jgi:hypothetical protein
MRTLKLKNGNIKKQNGELKVKFSVMRKRGTTQLNLTEPNLT